MEPLPMALSYCSLSEVELSGQLARYRSVGHVATALEKSPRRIAVRVSDGTPAAAIEALVAVEQQCCPFFDMAWEPRDRTLTISVPDADHEPALDALVQALGL
jgi:hypothetical protein